MLISFLILISYIYFITDDIDLIKVRCLGTGPYTGATPVLYWYSTEYMIFSAYRHSWCRKDSVPDIDTEPVWYGILHTAQFGLVRQIMDLIVIFRNSYIM